jgi:hypothetical protein
LLLCAGSTVGIAARKWAESLDNLVCFSAGANNFLLAVLPKWLCRQMNLILHMRLESKSKKYWKGFYSFITQYFVPGLVFD